MSIFDLFAYKTKALEVLYVLEGIKKTARLSVHEDELKKIKEFCMNNHLHAEISDFKVAMEFHNDKSYSDKGYKINADSKTKGSFFVYISKSEKICRKAKSAEQMNDHKAFGKLLGYPNCCIKFFIENNKEQEKRQNDYVLPALSNSKKPYSFYNNIAIRYFDVALLNHFPCSLNCKKSIKIAKQNLGVLQKYDPNLAKQFVELLKLPCIYTEKQGVHMLKDYEIINGMLYFKGVISSVKNNLHFELQNKKSINIQNNELLVFE